MIPIFINHEYHKGMDFNSSWCPGNAVFNSPSSDQQTCLRFSSVHPAKSGFFPKLSHKQFLPRFSKSFTSVHPITEHYNKDYFVVFLSVAATIERHGG